MKGLHHPSSDPSGSPEKRSFLSQHTFLPSPVASPSAVQHTVSPFSSSPPHPIQLTDMPVGSNKKSILNDKSVLSYVDTTSDEPAPCKHISATQTPIQQYSNDAFKPPLPKRRGCSSRKRLRDPRQSPPGLDIVKKRRLTQNSLWQNKFERQQHLYKGTNQSWLGCETRSPGAEWTPNAINAYKNLVQIGSGVYGSVYRGEAPSGKPVALKFLRLENERDGLPITAVREIKLLKHMNHQNVIKLLDMVTSKRMGKDARRKADIYMVLEWCDHDLSGLIHNPEFKFTEGVVKHFMKQIMEGFKYLHSGMGTLHRDVKPANILVNGRGDIKLADFGLSRVMDTKKALTNGHRIVTRWYRSPELLLGSQKYDYAIDMWSVGCVFGELITGKPVFPAREEIHQLGVVSDICGTIDVEDWPEAKLFGASLPKKHVRRRLKPHFREKMVQKRWSSENIEAALDLLDKLLKLNPKKRLSAEDGCKHSYFRCKPDPQVPVLPKECHHEWKYNKGRASHHRESTRQNHNRSQKQPLPRQNARQTNTNNHNRHRSNPQHHKHNNARQNDARQNDFEQRFNPPRNKPTDHYRHESRENNNRHRPDQYTKPNSQNQMGFFDYGAIDYGI